MKTAGSSEMLENIYQTAWLHIPVSSNMHSFCHENSDLPSDKRFEVSFPLLMRELQITLNRRSNRLQQHSACGMKKNPLTHQHHIKLTWHDTAVQWLVFMFHIWISDQGLNIPHWGFLGSSKFLQANSGIAPTIWPDHFFPNPITTHNQHTITHYTIYSDWKALLVTQEQINSQIYVMLVPPAAGSQDSAVGIGNGYRLHNQRSEFESW